MAHSELLILSYERTYSNENNSTKESARWI